MIRNLTLFCLILIASCNERRNTSSLQIIKYNSEFKDYISDGTTESSTTSLIMAYYGNSTLYAVPSTSYLLKKSLMKGDTILNELTPSNDTSYTYFVIKNNAKTGLRYDSLNSISGSKFKIDSLIRLINIDSENLKIFGVELGTPYKIIKTKDKTLEVFLDRTKNGTDTTYRYFDKGMNDLHFSFSQSLDKQKNSKLYKTRFVQILPINEYHATQRFVKRTDVIDEIKLLELENSQQLIDLFNRFEKVNK